MIPRDVVSLEARLIEGILTEPVATLAEVRRALSPRDLLDRRSRAVYGACLAVADRGEVVGTQAVWAQLVQTDQTPLLPEGLAGLVALETLAAPLPQETVDLAKRLTDLSRQRRAQSAAKAFAITPTPERRRALEAVLREEAEAGQQAAPAASAVTWASLVRETPPEVPWAIEGILPERGLGNLTGEVGGYKTWAAYDAAIDVMLGGEVWGIFPVRNPGPVVILDEENGTAEVSRRFSRLARGRGLAEQDLPLWVASYSGFQVDDRDSMEALLQFLEEKRPALVVMDSLIRFHSQDENSNSGMARVTAALRRITEAVGTSVLCLDHPRKMSQVSNAAIERSRGAKEKTAGLDSYLFSTPGRDGAVRIELAKLRHGIPRPPFSLRVEDTADGGTVIGHASMAEVAEDTNGVQDVFVRIRSGFVDVFSSYWAYDQITACSEAGIVGGFSDSGYRPVVEVTRDQMAVYIARALAGGDAYVPTAAHAVTFTDVPADHWAFRYVEYCYDAAVVQGYADGYHPTEVVNRAQMAVYVARSIVDPTGEDGLAAYTPPTTASFIDVPTDYWAYKHIEYCKAQSIVSGYSDGYRPEAAVTRDQMAVYVARAFGLS